MKAQDFRIGNYIIDHEAEPTKTIYWQIEEIQRLSNDKALNQTVGVTYRNGSCWTCDIEPVPLTEKHLLKLGFNTDYKKGYIGIDVNNSDFVLTYPKVMGEWQDNFTFQFETGRLHIFKELKYVHELQNLYFALTGSELVFSEA